MTDEQKCAKRKEDTERLADVLSEYFRAARITADPWQVRYIADKALLWERGGCLAGAA